MFFIPLTYSQFEIYFSSIHRVLQVSLANRHLSTIAQLRITLTRLPMFTKVNHPDFEQVHVIGDLTYIQPSASFQRFQANAKIYIPIVLEFWSVQETDNMPVSMKIHHPIACCRANVLTQILCPRPPFQRWFVVDER